MLLLTPHSPSRGERFLLRSEEDPRELYGSLRLQRLEVRARRRWRNAPGMRRAVPPYEAFILMVIQKMGSAALWKSVSRMLLYRNYTHAAAR